MTTPAVTRESPPAARAVSVSFAIPAYDRPALLAETLASIAAQTGDLAYDVTVCDDLGLLETRRTVERFPAGQFSYVKNPGTFGAVANWNRCLGAGGGEWVMVLHEDDTLYPWYLDSVRARLRPGLAAVCTRTVQGTERPVLARPGGPGPAAAYLPGYFIKGSMTPFPGVLLHRATALALGGFDERWGPLADYDFWYRLARVGRIEVIPSVGAFYRVSAGQWTERTWTVMLRRMHLLRLQIAREQFVRSPRLGRWLARFFTFRAAKSYARRFPNERPLTLARALRFGRIPLASAPSGWVWKGVQWSARQAAPAAVPGDRNL